MPRLIYFLIVAGFTNSCTNLDTEFSRFEKLIAPRVKLDTLKVDLSIDSRGFARGIADSLSVNLCDTTLSFISILPLTDEKARIVDLNLYEIRNPDFPSLEKLEILVRSENEARIHFTYVPMDSVKYRVLHELESRNWRDKKIRIQFGCEWQNVSKQTVSKMFEESIMGLNLFAEKKARQWFNKDLENLSEEEFREFKENFVFNLDIAPVRPDPPPRDSL